MNGIDINAPIEPVKQTHEMWVYRMLEEQIKREKTVEYETKQKLEQAEWKLREAQSVRDFCKNHQKAALAELANYTLALNSAFSNLNSEDQATIQKEIDWVAECSAQFEKDLSRQRAAAQNQQSQSNDAKLQASYDAKNRTKK